MIGSGTDIAIFSSFLTEHETVRATGKNWTFFTFFDYRSDESGVLGFTIVEVQSGLCRLS